MLLRSHCSGLHNTMFITPSYVQTCPRPWTLHLVQASRFTVAQIIVLCFLKSPHTSGNGKQEGAQQAKMRHKGTLVPQEPGREAVKSWVWTRHLPNLCYNWCLFAQVFSRTLKTPVSLKTHRRPKLHFWH